MTVESSPDSIDAGLLAVLGDPSPGPVLEVLEDFAEAIPGFLESLAHGLATGDGPAVVDLLHRQKGAAGSLGLAGLHAALVTLEKTCREDTLPGPEVAAALRPIASGSIEAARSFLGSRS